jgi:DNA replication and repair protein RecF
MLQLKNISLTQFKNYGQKQFLFNEKVVAICGNNGIGKTNLLDAIHYLCFTKSYFTKMDANNVMHGQQGFRVLGEMQKNDEPFTINCVLRETGKKELQVNGTTCAKFSSHIGQFPLVMIAPDDVALITDGSEERRKFVDTLICQLNADYLHQLISYNKVLLQRNSLLKQFAEAQQRNMPLLEVLDEQLMESGNKIFATRNKVLQTLLPLVGKYYSEIAAQEEGLALQYESSLHTQTFGQLLQQNREKDFLSQRTNGGIHKDDLGFTLQDEPFKQTASQGQRKSLLFALKLAEFDMLQKNKGFSPLLLLDDIFEKLDAQRMHNLLQKVCIENQGQVFITDTHAERLHSNLSHLKINYQLIELA